MSNSEKAQFFSTGKFEVMFPLMNEHTIWEIIGEKNIIGKDNIIEHCKITAFYFQSIITEFTIDHTIVQNNKIAIYGNAIFIRDKKIINQIAACDLYIFEREILHSISSYCIPTKP